MPDITHGTISYERKLNTGDYSHKLPRVELSFTVENEDPRVAAMYVGLIARDVATALAGEAEPLPAARAETSVVVTEDKKPRQSRKTAAGPAPETADAMADASVSTPSKPPVSTPGQVFNAAGQATDPMAAAPAATTPVETQQDDAAMGGTPVIETPAAATTAPAVPAQVEAIAVADLTNAVVRTMVALTPILGNEVAAAKIGELIREFAPDVMQIAVDKREEFLARLKTLA